MRVKVITGSRLHGGFYYIGRSWGVYYGGLGFYSELPKLVLEAWECSDTRIYNLDDFSSVITGVLDKLGLSNVCLMAKESIPIHVGLGSTTQTLLAVGVAIGKLKGINYNIIELAKLLGRGRVSGVGTLLFKYGGFILDSGNPDIGGPRTLLRLRVPGEWRFVILIPEAKRGLSEDEESNILREPIEPSSHIKQLMSRGALRLASAIARRDLQEALEGLREVQTGTGLYFSTIQGGVYRSDLEDLVSEASKAGLVLAQSSWGPTLYTITSKESARADANMLLLLMRELGIRGNVLLAKPRNMGARVALGG